MDPYKVLGVERDATNAQIKAAHRKLMSAAHPDRQGGSHERMSELNLAREILLDPELRKAFDETGHIGPSMTKNTELRARDWIIKVIDQALLQTDDTHDMIGFMRARLNEEAGRATNCRADCERKLEIVRRRMKRLKGPPGSVIENVLQTSLDRGADFLRNNALESSAIKLAIDMLDVYSYDTGREAGSEPTFFYIEFGR